MEQNMKTQIFVMIQNVAKHGFQRKIDLKNGQKIKEKKIGKRFVRLLIIQKDKLLHIMDKL